MRIALRGLWLLLPVAAAAISRDAVPAWLDDNFGTDSNRKQNFCQVPFDRGNASTMTKVLEGREISVVVNTRAEGQSFFNFASYNASTKRLTGYLVEVLDEMARLGGFRWRDSFTLVPRDPAVPHTDYLVWASKNYDFVVDWATQSPERAAAGLTPLVPFMDTSLHLLVKPLVEKPSFLEEVFSFLSPLSMWVWISLLVISLVTAKLYVFFEGDAGDFEGEETKKRPYEHSVYLAFATFTGGGGLSPETKAGKLLNFAFTFLVLLVVSAYTANLASLLVVNASYSVPVQSLAEAALKSLPVCTGYADAVEDLSSEHGLVWRLKEDLPSAYKGVRDGECAAGLVRRFTWRAAKENMATNPGCKLYMMPDIIQEERGGFIGQIPDTVHNECDHRADHVFNIILLQMFDSGFFRTLNKKYFKPPTGQAGCPPGLPAVPNTDSSALSFTTMSGIFIVYSFAMLLAIVVHRFYKTSSDLARSSGDDSASSEAEKML